MIDTPPRDLTPGEETSLVKISSYRAALGRAHAETRRLRSILRDLRDHTAPGTPERSLVEQGLGE